MKATAIVFASFLMATALASNNFAAVYSDDACKVASIASVMVGGSCADRACTGKMKVACVKDIDSALEAAFGSNPYVTIKKFNGAGCKTAASAVGVAADGQCHGMNVGVIKASTKASVGRNGDLPLVIYADDSCTEFLETSSMNVTAADLKAATCMSDLAGSVTITYSKGSANAPVFKSDAQTITFGSTLFSAGVLSALLHMWQPR